jgi:hypothetical protein
MKYTYEWYEVQVEFYTESENPRTGEIKEKTIKEAYLINAMSPTEAEAKFTEFATEKRMHEHRVIKAVEKKYVRVIGHSA